MNKKQKLDRNRKSLSGIAAEFDNFCKAMREHLSTYQMRRILQTNDQDPMGLLRTIFMNLQANNK